MPFRTKRQTTPFGVMLHKRGRVGSNLLITKNGRMLGFRHGEKLGNLLKNVRIDKWDRVKFGKNVHPKEIGHGIHAKVFRVYPKEEAQFVEAKHGHLPSVVLKVYRESVSKKEKPDGFTQFVANSFVFNYLKKLSTKTYEVKSLHTYFVSEKLLVRKFINAPTLEEVFRATTKGVNSNESLSEALTNNYIFDFIRKNKIGLGEINMVDAELLKHVNMGAKNGFGTNLDIVPDFTHLRNVFVLGRVKSGKLAVSVIDQGMKSIPNIGNKIRKGTLLG